MGNRKDTSGLAMEAFAPEKISQSDLVIDGTQSHEPVLVFFEKGSERTYVRTYSQFVQEHGIQLLSNFKPESVKFLVPVIDSDFIPHSLFDASLLEEYGKFILDDGLSPLLSMDFPATGSVMVYREYLPSVKLLAHLFPQAERVPFPLVFTKSVGNRIQAQGDKIVGVHVAHDFVAMCVFKNGLFSYYHEFQINNLDEFNYYLILVMKMVDPSPANINLILSGDIGQDDPFFQRIARYTSNIHFIHSLSCASLVADLKV